MNLLNLDGAEESSGESAVAAESHAEPFDSAPPPRYEVLSCTHRSDHRTTTPHYCYHLVLFERHHPSTIPSIVHSIEVFGDRQLSTAATARLI
jgi:hypothetical protein